MLLAGRDQVLPPPWLAERPAPRGSPDRVRKLMPVPAYTSSGRAGSIATAPTADRANVPSPSDFHVLPASVLCQSPPTVPTYNVLPVLSRGSTAAATPMPAPRAKRRPPVG